jgi:hypothetical protein
LIFLFIHGTIRVFCARIDHALPPFERRMKLRRILMNKIALLLAATLPLAYTIARADPRSSADLRYCLDLPTDQQIAKCAGETSGDGKKTPYTKEEVERILSERAASAPASAGTLSTPPAATGSPDKEPAPAEAGQKAAEPKETGDSSN